jgi:hypothetical protein
VSDPVGLDPWSVLGLSEGASYEAVHRVYRLRCQLLHPDRHVGARSDVVAEAERSMKELNFAWEQLRDQLVRKRSGPRDRPSGTTEYGDAWGGEEALNWLLDAILSTADAYGDRVDDRELKYLLRPVRNVQSVRKLERWLARRTPTLLAAMAAGRIADWCECAAILDDGGIDTVVVLLLDRCLPDAAKSRTP